jgi:L-ribulose-5-phosphate 4-epimerase
MNSKNLSDLKREVYEANLKLAGSGLVFSTFGNVSGIDREAGIVAIKPSGVAYQAMNVEDIVLVSLKGDKVERESLNPSSDTPTHLELYRNFKDIKGITHTHSEYASAFAQARMAIPCLGTTHADYFFGPVPVTSLIKDACISSDYELETGKLIVETFKNMDYNSIKACLVACHGPFTWGDSADVSVETAIILEHIAGLAWRTLMINSAVKGIKKTLLYKHYLRKHGEDAYYGQKKLRS